MRILKNRLVIGCVCVILAFVLGFVGLPLVIDKMSDKVHVVVASQNIESGTQLSEKMFRIIEMSVGDLPYTTAELYSGITGKTDDNIFNTTVGNQPKYAASDISANDFVSKKKVSATAPYRDKELRELGDDEYAVTIAVGSLDSSVSGKIRPGDVVTLMMASSKGGKEALTYNEVRYMEIIGVSTKEGADITSSSSDSLPAFVTFKCNLRQAKILAQINMNYKIHMAFAAHASSEKAGVLLEGQRRYLEQLEKSEEEAKNAEQEKQKDENGNTEVNGQ